MMQPDPMKILQLCNKPPLPAKDGGCIAMNNITRGLIAAGHQVKILTIFTHKHEFDPDSLPGDYLDQTRIEGVFVDTRINVVDAFSNFMTADSYNVSRFFSTDFDIKLTNTLQKEDFDIVHVESLFMTSYIGTVRRMSSAAIILRSHNLEFVIWEKIARGTSQLARRTYLKYLSRKLKEYELSMLGQVDGIAAISEEDKSHFRKLGSKKPMVTIPFGIPLDEYAPAEEEPELALFHIGAMDWSPNLEGILWFLEEVWPLINSNFPQLRFYLAGRNMPQFLVDTPHPNVFFCGEVENAADFMRSKSIMVVPLLSGGGIRVKIIEGMALEKAIVSTSLGAEGIDFEKDKNILIADNPQQWLEAIRSLVVDPSLVKKLGQEGKALVASKYDNAVITKELLTFYRSLIKA